MVIYDLECENRHQFEGWFKNADELLEQQRLGILSCPICNSLNVAKKLTAAKVARKSNSSSIATSSQAVASGSDNGPGAPSYQELQKLLSQVHKHVDQNFTDVGNRFADEALKIHRGEKDAENIRGVASKAEIKVLAEEGVAALPLPPKPVDKDKLN